MRMTKCIKWRHFGIAYAVMFFIEQNLIFNGTCMWFDLVTIETSLLL